MTEQQIYDLIDELKTISQEIDEDRLPRWRDLSYTLIRSSNTILKLQHKVNLLEEWIAKEGERNDTCTAGILGVRCSYCQCWRKDKK